jgi:predicted ATPase
LLGYIDQALKRSEEALTLAQEVAHPFSLALALFYTALLHLFRREGQAVRERAEALISLSREHEVPFWVGAGTIEQGWVLTEQGEVEEGIEQMRQGLAAYQARGAELMRPYFLALLSDAYRKAGQADEGLTVLAEALATAHKTGECFYQAELYRLKGELLLNADCGIQNKERHAKKKED